MKHKTRMARHAVQLALVVVLLVIVIDLLLGQWITAAAMSAAWVICLFAYLFGRGVERRYE